MNSGSIDWIAGSSVKKSRETMVLRIQATERIDMMIPAAVRVSARSAAVLHRQIRSTDEDSVGKLAVPVPKADMGKRVMDR